MESGDEARVVEEQRILQEEHFYFLHVRLREEVTRLIREDSCGSSCLSGKAENLEGFLLNMWSMTRKEKKLCIKTSIAILAHAEISQPARTRGNGDRRRFKYYLPFVGCVCKSSFLRGFDVSAPTVARYKHQLNCGRLMGSLNQISFFQATDVDEDDDEDEDEDEDED
jgi:hypothetical protein